MTIELLEQKIKELEARVDALEEEITVKRAERKIGISLEEAKARLTQPVERGPEDIKEALSIVGICEGPEDLSENLRSYLREAKE